VRGAAKGKGECESKISKDVIRSVKLDLLKTAHEIVMWDGNFYNLYHQQLVLLWRHTQQLNCLI